MTAFDRQRLQAEWGERLHFFAETDSTNEQALALGRAGAVQGTVVLAERQTAGRGRRGAAWFCGEGTGLAFSLLLRPSFARVLWPRLSLVAGLAVAQAIEKEGLFPEIKWPNDLLLRGRKVCGILVESESDFVVVGIGLNVGHGPFPPEVANLATSLAAEGGGQGGREDYLSAIVCKVLSLLNWVPRDFSQVIAPVRERCALQGREIDFLLGGESHRGFCEGIGPGGELLVREGEELKRHFAADQIRVR
ncbi:biotin--[acetyl-CoA-carboxylase] ligase [Roseibacillus ishigakijimensis]|uniref:Biotin--[acetyl-CoA-carboxylase] ligase n=1 Tax=Roseibacillus ishigakijimensis TaxID=454146 RepID=A0A934VMX0_9BACT|nr:biotin--[acetyl-CoA-carboxylase] ligase [Roseibacillus ishigakijimensis]MBK1834707.1 biotin--[acetyl-CoA-carboxylase] ligase [Roseibacillus ishigakijimensis]